MKDFYYILGLQPTASADDIKKAYRKLSHKFHPDKNEGDAFFAERFLEVQQAYETLIEPLKRQVYDAERSRGFSSVAENGSPVIEHFNTDTTSFAFGQVVCFRWQTTNADRVSIEPFGVVQPSGEKKYKFKDYKNAALNFELIAENKSSGKRARATITLTNATYHEMYQFFKQKILADNQQGTKHSHHKSASFNSKRPVSQQQNNERMYLAARPILIIIAVLAILLIVIFFATSL